jgi:hypothetical protein
MNRFMQQCFVDDFCRVWVPIDPCCANCNFPLHCVEKTKDIVSPAGLAVFNDPSFLDCKLMNLDAGRAQIGDVVHSVRLLANLVVPDPASDPINCDSQTAQNQRWRNRIFQMQLPYALSMRSAFQAKERRDEIAFACRRGTLSVISKRR